MPLATGQKLTHYEILGSLGAGGMGEVYRARDTKLDREVAIKVLPAALASDEQRIQRFQREAKLLASLNHTHVAQIFGVDREGETSYLVLELVPGETLGERIARGPLPIDEALEIARQIADGLEAAHEAGVVHRDLKPDNIRITPDGSVKVLDFGLAKSTRHDAGPISSSTAKADSFELTREGMVFGTPTYMSPEQARGKANDRRTDVWAFGCVLYECLTGARAFGGETVTDVLAAVLDREPDWSKLPATTPRRLRSLLERCLVKDPKHRLRDIGDARLEIEQVIAGDGEVGGETIATARTTSSWARWIGWVVAAVAVGYELWPKHAEVAPRTASVARFELGGPPLAFSSIENDAPLLAVARDGSKVVHAGRNAEGQTRLFLRPLDSLQVTELGGTEGASAPFLSPDGEWIGFFTGNHLKKISVHGGAPIELATVDVPRGGSWSDDGWIYFPLATEGGISRVRASGGKPEEVTKLDAAKSERTHRWPCVLPGGKALLYTAATSRMSTFDEARIVLRELDTGAERTLIDVGSYARYSDTGHVLYMRGASVFALRFDLATLRSSGTASIAADGVVARPFSGAAEVDVANGGLLVYAQGASQLRERGLNWIDRTGKRSPATNVRSPYLAVDVTRDGRTAAISLDGATTSVWLLDLERDTRTRLTVEWTNNRPVWLPDQQHMSILTVRHGHWGCDILSTSGESQPLAQFDQPALVSTWTPDGREAAVEIAVDEHGHDIAMLSRDNGQLRPLLHSSFDERGPRFSDDGRWLAYSSDESGREELYVVAFPACDHKVRVSSGGGGAARWSRDGRELFYLAGEHFMAVNVHGDAELTFGAPRELFTVHPPEVFRSPYDVAPDGQRFLFIEDDSVGEQRAPIVAVQNWPASIGGAK